MNNRELFNHRSLMYLSSLDELLERIDRERRGLEPIANKGDPNYCTYRFKKLRKVRK